jgi:AcrR family transcriptional regulator
MNEYSFNKGGKMAPKNEAQFQQIRDERREHILAHALGVFTQKGYSGTKISDVAENASLSQGLIYRYFASKEALFNAVVEQTIELSNEAMKQWLDLPVEPKDKMLSLTLANLGFRDSMEYAQRFLLMFQVCLNTSVPKHVRELYGHKFIAIDCVKDIIAEGQKMGQFSSQKEPGSLSTAYWSIIQGIVFFSALNHSGLGVTVEIPDAETVLKLFQD